MIILARFSCNQHASLQFYYLIDISHLKQLNSVTKLYAGGADYSAAAYCSRSLQLVRAKGRSP